MIKNHKSYKSAPSMSLWFVRRNSELTFSGEGIYEVCEWTFMRVSLENLSCVIVECKYHFTSRKVLNERSASQDVTAIGSTITPINIFPTFGKVTAFASWKAAWGVLGKSLPTKCECQAQPQQQIWKHQVILQKLYHLFITSSVLRSKAWLDKA